MRLKMSPAMAVALLALVMSMTGTAVAAKSLITGKDIKDGSITSADIAKGAIKSKNLAKKSVKSANIANGAVGQTQINRSYVPPTICPNGVIVMDTSCPSFWADAQGTDLSLPYTFPVPGTGTTCYGGPVMFETGSSTGYNKWDRASGFGYVPGNGAHTVTINTTWGNTQDTTTVGVSIVKIGPNNTRIPVPDAVVKMPPAQFGDTAMSLNYVFPPGQPGQEDTFSIEAYSCSTGAPPSLKSAALYYTSLST